jgi:hypothetical protein
MSEAARTWEIGRDKGEQAQQGRAWPNLWESSVSGEGQVANRTDVWGVTAAGRKHSMRREKLALMSAIGGSRVTANVWEGGST